MKKWTWNSIHDLFVDLSIRTNTFLTTVWLLLTCFPSLGTGSAPGTTHCHNTALQISSISASWFCIARKLYAVLCRKKRRLSHELGLIIFRTLPVPESSSNEAYLAHISCQVSTRPSGHGEMAGKGGGGEISSVEPSQLRWDPSGHQTHDILLSPRLSFCLHVPVSQSEETLVSL